MFVYTGAPKLHAGSRDTSEPRLHDVYVKAALRLGDDTKLATIKVHGDAVELVDGPLDLVIILAFAGPRPFDVDRATLIDRFLSEVRRDLHNARKRDQWPAISFLVGALLGSVYCRPGGHPYKGLKSIVRRSPSLHL